MLRSFVFMILYFHVFIWHVWQTLNTQFLHIPLTLGITVQLYICIFLWHVWHEINQYILLFIHLAFIYTFLYLLYFFTPYSCGQMFLLPLFNLSSFISGASAFSRLAFCTSLHVISLTSLGEIHSLNHWFFTLTVHLFDMSDLFICTVINLPEER